MTDNYYLIVQDYLTGQAKSFDLTSEYVRKELADVSEADLAYLLLFKRAALSGCQMDENSTWDFLDDQDLADRKAEEMEEN